LFFFSNEKEKQTTKRNKRKRETNEKERQTKKRNKRKRETKEKESP